MSQKPAIQSTTLHFADDTAIEIKDRASASGCIILSGPEVMIFLTEAAEARLREALNIRAGQRVQILRFPERRRSAGDVAASIIAGLGSETIPAGRIGEQPTTKGAAE